MDIIKIYKKLEKKYGPQGWWPIYVSPGDTLKYNIPYNFLKKYRTPHRDPFFEIAIGSILAQSTAWKNVAKAIVNLYNAKALTPKAIMNLKQARLCKLIRPAGYFRQKCRKVKIFSKWLVDEFNGDILGLRKHKVETVRGKLLNLWGIGKETADSIILYALNMSSFMIDEYTRRLCKNYKVELKEYDEYKKFFESAFAARKNKLKIYNYFVNY